jgi:choline-sulfatase
MKSNRGTSSIGPHINLVLVICAMLALCCGARPERLNVLIIAVDTLRADHLGCYGYTRETSPNIDHLAEGGVLCRLCTSQAPWTLPSFTTVFTSLYPTQHGAETVHSTLRDSIPTLATILKEHGYTTGAIVNAPALKPAYGVDRGFDYYNMTPLEGRAADGTTRDALAWLDTVEDEPFFAFVHYFDPHLAYAPPASYRKRFTVDYEGRIGSSFNLEGFSRVRDTMFVEMRDLTQADWNRIVGLYDAEIAFTDSAIAQLIRGLDERNLSGNTLIVFLSDHGEEFFEHGGFEHGHSLYEELIHVPLLFRLPGKLASGARVSQPVRLLDVAPTILDFLGVERPAAFEGVSLMALLEGNAPPDNRKGTLLPRGASYSEALMHGREQKCVKAYPWKLVFEMDTETKHLFNLADDPGELHDVLEEYPDRTARLEDMLFHVVFGLSDTWYVALNAGADRTVFDIDLTAERGPAPGNISPYRLLDDDGRILAQPGASSFETSGSRLRLENLDLKGSVTLAFKVYPERFPVDFDLKIDGRSAAEQTYLGESLEPAGTMPFSVKGRRGRVKSPGRPARTPEPPYILVWYESGRYGGDTPVKLDEETKRELRSLGYIQ